MESATQLAPIVAPVLICTGIGVLWAWLGRPFDADLIARLTGSVGVPCLIIATFAKAAPDPAAMGEVALAAVLCYGAVGALGATALKAAGMPVPSYLPPLMLPMTGTLGLPVCAFAFGATGLALALIYYAIGVVASAAAEGAPSGGRDALGRLARTPALYAMAVAMSFALAGETVPAWARNATGLLGDIVIPLLLVALGVRLFRLRVARPDGAAMLSAARLGMGVAAGYGVAQALGLTGPAWAVVIVQSAMPVALAADLRARAGDLEKADVGGAILVSSVIALIALPLLLSFVL